MKTTSSILSDALDVAKAYIHAVETKNHDSVAGLLTEDIRHEFPLPGSASEKPGAIFEGKKEVMDYIDSLFVNFTILSWPEADWTPSADNKRVFLQAKGDMVVAHSNAPYHNTYLIRFDIEDGKITQVTEFANSELYLSLNIEPPPVMLKAIERAANS